MAWFALPDASSTLTLVVAITITAVWSFTMAWIVAPRRVMRILRGHIQNINDPDDEFAGDIRHAAGSLFAMATSEVGKNPAMLSPVVGAFWTNIRQRAIGAKGGMSTVVPDDMLAVAMEEGPEVVAGVAEMFGVSGRAAKALGKVTTAYLARKGLRENGGIPALGEGEGGPEWWQSK